MATTPTPAVARSIITRDEAQARGLKRYYTGEPCKRGHVCDRFVSNAGCVMCVNRATPTKNTLRGRNVGWPSVGLIFTITPPPSPEEMEAAFRMVEAWGWHDHCVKLLREDATLLERFLIPAPVEEQARLLLELEKQQRIREAVQQRLATPMPTTAELNRKVQEMGESVTQNTESPAVPADTSATE